MFQIILHNNIVPPSILRDLTRNIYFDFIIFMVFYIYISRSFRNLIAGIPVLLIPPLSFEETNRDEKFRFNTNLLQKCGIFLPSPPTTLRLISS